MFKFFLLLMSLIQFNAYASTINYSSVYLSCLKKSDGVSAETVKCNKAEAAIQDKRLNQKYNKYLALIEPRIRTAIQKAQRAWIPFRDAECDTEYAIEAPGSNAEVMRTGCILDMTQDRANTFSQKISFLKSQ